MAPDCSPGGAPVSCCGLPPTRRTDLGEKRDAYLTMPSLQVLILVESEAAAVTVHRRKPEGGLVGEYHTGLEDTIPLPEIDAALALAELYERVTFAPLGPDV